MNKFVKDGYIFNTGPATLVCEWLKTTQENVKRVIKLFKSYNGYFITSGDEFVKTYLTDTSGEVLIGWLEEHVPDHLIIEHFEDKFIEF